MMRHLAYLNVSLIAVVFGAPAWAQVSQLTDIGQAAKGSEGAEVGEIVVTGSRIQRRDYISPSPITTESIDSIKATGAVNVEQALNQLPQFSPAQGASNGTALGGGGRATLNLRGLGEQRNLVLLDGRRLPASNALGVVDINILPTGILQGVEVISGGASAVYGSDAVSGVVNFKSLSNFEGLSFETQYGNSFKADARTFSADLTAGGRFSDGRGHFLFSGSYTERQGLEGQSRSFFNQAITGSSSTGMGVINYLPGNMPSQAAVNAVFAKYGIAAGTVAASSGVGFNNDGTLFAATGGANLKPVSSVYRITNGIFTQVVAPDNTIIIPQKRYNLFAKFDYEISPTLTVYAQGLYSQIEQKMAQGYPLTVPTRPTVSASNPFIPADLALLLASRPNPTAPFQLNRRFVEVGKRYYDEPFTVFQILVGAKGKLPFGDFSYDLFASHDETKNPETLETGVSSSRLANLLLAADGGASICAGGYNPFGLGNALRTSAACLDYISVQAHNNTVVKQDVVEGTLQGSLFNLPAGPVKVALTAGYRKNSYDYSPDTLYQATPTSPNGDIFGITPTSPVSGSTNVTEFAAEILVPIMRDQRFVESLNASFGYRYSDYNLSGGVSTYKAEFDWRIVPAVLLRGGYERAVRAPNIAEFFTAPTGALATIGLPSAAGDPCDFGFGGRSGPNATSIRNLCLAQGVPVSIIDTFNYRNGQVTATVSGNLNLKPEVADTFTAGIVLSPRFSTPLLSKLSISVDYYKIDLRKAISTTSGVDIINKCFNLDGSNPSYSNSNLYCGLIQRDSATGTISSVKTPYLNLGGYKTSGVDVQLDWRVDLDALGVRNSNLNFRSVVNYLDSFKIQNLPGAAFAEYAGTIGTPPLPRWKALTTLTYGIDDITVGLRWRYVGRMDDVTIVTRPQSPSPGVSSYNLFDLVGSIGLFENVRVSGGITNLFNKRPLVVAGILGTTNGGLYDTIGRSYYLSTKVKF